MSSWISRCLLRIKKIQILFKQNRGFTREILTLMGQPLWLLRYLIWPIRFSFNSIILPITPGQKWKRLSTKFKIERSTVTLLSFKSKTITINSKTKSLNSVRQHCNYKAFQVTKAINPFIRLKMENLTLKGPKNKLKWVQTLNSRTKLLLRIKPSSRS